VFLKSAEARPPRSSRGSPLAASELPTTQKPPSDTADSEEPTCPNEGLGGAMQDLIERKERATLSDPLRVTEGLAGCRVIRKRGTPGVISHKCRFGPVYEWTILSEPWVNTTPLQQI
jgi:hypothetical protein